MQYCMGHNIYMSSTGRGCVRCGYSGLAGCDVWFDSICMNIDKFSSTQLLAMTMQS